MKFSFSEEQTEFRNMLRRFLQDRSPTTEVRRVAETEAGYDPEIWRMMAEELGVTAIHIPEAYGGAGFGISELAIAAEEAGRALLPSALFRFYRHGGDRHCRSRRRRPEAAPSCPALRAARRLQRLLPPNPEPGGMPTPSPQPPIRTARLLAADGSQELCTGRHGCRSRRRGGPAAGRQSRPVQPAGRQCRPCAPGRCNPWTRPVGLRRWISTAPPPTC